MGVCLKSTFHSKRFTEQNWQNTPETFINSIGGGLCGVGAAYNLLIYGVRWILIPG